jgi:hypothetical protein
MLEVNAIIFFFSPSAVPCFAPDELSRTGNRTLEGSMIPPEHFVENRHSSPLTTGKDSWVESASAPDAIGYSEEEAGDMGATTAMRRLSGNTDSLSKTVRKMPV